MVKVSHALNYRDDDGATGVSLLEKRRHEDILEKETVEHIAIAVKKRMLRRFGHGKRRDGAENISTVAEMTMDGAPYGKTQVEMEGHSQNTQ